MEWMRTKRLFCCIYICFYLLFPSTVNCSPFDYLELSVGHPVLEISSAHTCWSGLLPRMQPPVGERRGKPWRMSSRSTRFLSTVFGRLLGNVTIGHHGGHQYFLNRNILLVSSPTPLSGKPRLQTGGGWRKPPCTSESAQKGEELIKPKKGVGMISGGGCLIVEE